MERIDEEDKKESHEELQGLQIVEDEGDKQQQLEFKKNQGLCWRKNWLYLVGLAVVILVFLAYLRYYRSIELQKKQAKQINTQKLNPEALIDDLQSKTTKNDINQQVNINSNTEKGEDALSTNSNIEEVQNFNRIIWVQTDDELETKQMEIAVVAQNLIHYAKKAGFEVRIVNNHNAYDWLSDEMIAFIKDTHQKSKVDLPVYELLRLALLIELGGVLLRLPDIILLDNLQWIDSLLTGSSIQDGDALSCKSNQIDVIIHHQQQLENKWWFKDDFIAAKPQSALLKLLLSEISRIVKVGQWPYLNYNITTINADTQVITFPRITQTLINIFHKQHYEYNSNLCAKYRLQSFDEINGRFMGTIPANHTSKIFKNSEQEFFKGGGKKYLLRINTSELVNDIANIIKTGNTTFGKDNSLLQNKLMMAEGNRWLTKPKDQIRQVHLCIVSLRQQRIQDYERQMKDQLQHLKKQTFTKWNLVNFIQNLPNVFKKIDQRVMLVNASAYEGLNLQRAATKYCGPKSIIFLLDYDETLTNVGDLQKLAVQFKPIGAFAAFFNLKTINSIIQPILVGREVRRRTYVPKKPLLIQIGNLMRAFTVQSYRFIASFDLRHSSGRYFDRQIALLSMLELSQHFSPCEKGNIVYQVRRLEEYMDIPRRKVFTNITIISNHFKVADMSLYQYFAKLRYRHICGTIKFYQQYVAPVQMMAVFNDGTEERGLAAKKGMPELIPRKIHQIWVRGEVPQFKQFLMTRLRDAHPDYQYFLWSEKNITRQNFPEGYDLMQTLIEWDKKSPYNKMSVVSDIIRSEAVYNHGGFYLDTNYMLFKNRSLDQFLSYSFVTAGQLSPRQRMFRDTAIFGAVKHSPRLARLISHRTLSSRNFFSIRAAKQAGPGLFGRTLRGNEQLQKDVFQPGFEQFYPNFLYDPGNPNRNRCQAPLGTPESNILFKSSKSYLKNCSEIYPYAFGLDFFAEGLSWQKRKWR